MSELKTLKDLKRYPQMAEVMDDHIFERRSAIEIKELKQEAIKWDKKSLGGVSPEGFRKFFNITEEDLE